ncbi:hypothetical protein [Streptomyces sp. JJ36]|uniref:hypothetical protein n=1 Tax=Streptomyces sp. JJ36 TaxID=2736645 RepID=UPI001F3CBED7|nr:hypothetical protein [Streptomyces sp. JJ36]MCF6526058.1 hypothetical protein [Streptomyces sp. JJ36]
MMTEAMTALAAAGGTAVVQAAGTDAWSGLRTRVAVLLGRGEPECERHELERLDRTAAELTTATDDGTAEVVRARQEATWQTRFEGLLEVVPAEQREAVAADLRALIDELPAAARPATVHNEISGGTQHGPVVQGRDVHHLTIGGSGTAPPPDGTAAPGR